MAERKWTKEQLDAINAESGTLLVSAAAGSGKTSVLVERIVRKLTSGDPPCAPEALLVVTFTNAAAAEMRTRIFRRIKEKADAGGENAEFLGNLPSRLGEMTVSTIDAFCMQLVRDNFNDCSVEPDFTVLDEAEEKALKNAAVSRIIEDRYASGKPDFMSLTGLFEAGRDDASLIEGIIALSDFSMSEPDPSLWLDGVADNFLNKPVMDGVWGKILAKRFVEGLDYCIALSEAALSDISREEAIYEKNESLFRLDIEQLVSAKDAVSSGSWDEAGEAVNGVYKSLSSRKFDTPKGMGGVPAKVCALGKRNEVKDALKKLMSLYCATEDENTEDISVLAPAVKELTDAVKCFNAELLRLKGEKNSYSFSDIEHFALGLLYDPASDDGKTDLARELSDELDEILIDEYQDTNRAQERLFMSLSKNGENLFTVGDVKQSIYRFRLASPEIFTEKTAQYPYYDGVHKRSKIILDKNFRSRREVTETVNYVFSSLMSKDCGEIEYSGDELLCPAAEYPESKEHDTEFYLVEAGETGAVEAEAAFCAALIRDKIRSGLTVFENGENRAAGYGDFCILLRVGKSPADIYAAALRRAGIPVNVDTRGGFFESADIKTLLSLLRVIDNPLRDIDMLAVMMSPLFGFSVQRAAEIRSDFKEKTGGKDFSLYAALSSAAGNGDAQAAGLLDAIAYYRRLSASESADGIIRRIFDETPLLHIAGAKEQGELRVADLRALYEASAGFSSDGMKSVGAFLRYVDTLRENGAQLRSGNVSEAKNSVSIMTMHRSKGLEFPFVIIGGLSKKFNFKQNSKVLGVSHEYGVGLKRREAEKIKLYDTLSSTAVEVAGKGSSLSEELRIYYVAMTRAKEKLFILAGIKDVGNKISGIEAIVSGTGSLPPFFVSSAVFPYEWFIAAFLRHPDAKALRRLSNDVVDADFNVFFKTVSPEPPTDREAAAKTSSADAELTENIRKKLSFSYKYLPVAGALSKHTASTLSDEGFSPQHFAQSAPSFVYKDSAAPADVGTATHKFLEYCDFSSSDIDVGAELERLTSCGRLSAAQARMVDREAVKEFFSSEVFRRILNADEVIREREFTMAKPVRELDPSVPEEFADEKTVVIGKTDLVFIENGGAVIVDYKTDRIKDIGVLAARYSAQLELYAEAVKKAWGYDVKEKLLYSLCLKQYLSL